jgi:hypothetical protein
VDVAKWHIIWGRYDDGDNDECASKAEALEKIRTERDEHDGPGKLAYGFFDSRGNFTQEIPEPKN